MKDLSVFEAIVGFIWTILTYFIQLCSRSNDTSQIMISFWSRRMNVKCSLTHNFKSTETNTRLKKPFQQPKKPGEPLLPSECWLFLGPGWFPAQLLHSDTDTVWWEPGHIHDFSDAKISSGSSAAVRCEEVISFITSSSPNPTPCLLNTVAIVTGDSVL